MKKPVIEQRLRKPNSDRDLRKISIHAKKRFKERFEYPLSDEELVEIEMLIRAGLGKVVNWTHGHPGVYLVSWKEFEFFAVFEYRTAKIIKFSTKEMEFRESSDQCFFESLLSPAIQALMISPRRCFKGSRNVKN